MELTPPDVEKNKCSPEMRPKFDPTTKSFKNFFQTDLTKYFTACGLVFEEKDITTSLKDTPYSDHWNFICQSETSKTIPEKIELLNKQESELSFKIDNHWLKKEKEELKNQTNAEIKLGVAREWTAGENSKTENASTETKHKTETGTEQDVLNAFAAVTAGIREIIDEDKK